jgi:spore germination cell wall hydrolase CwlJ-like protein
MKPLRPQSLLLLFLIIVAVLIGLFTHGAPAATTLDPRPSTLDPDLAVRALIGEASGEGERGMLAVAGALRNRGTLRGVYGLRAKHVDRQPAYVWTSARRAWAMSATNDLSAGATHWENTRAFGVPYWAKTMRVTATIGNHTFYQPR